MPRTPQIILFVPSTLTKFCRCTDDTILIKPKCTYTSNGIDIIEIKIRCNRICTVHYAHILKVMSFVDVDGTFPEVMYTILVCLFCGLNTEECFCMNLGS